MKFVFILNLLIGFLVPQITQAKTVDLIQVKAEMFPSKKYSVGIDIDSNQLITQVYFNIDGEYHSFDLDKLNDFVTIFSFLGVTLVRLKIIEKQNEQSATIALRIITNRWNGRYVDLPFQVSFNEKTKEYEIFDIRKKDEKKLVHAALVETAYSIVPIGVKNIKTW